MGWCKRLLKRARLDRELDRELAYHVERRIAELVATGIDPREAARRVRLEFGGADAVKEACRDARGTRWAEDFSLKTAATQFRTNGRETRPSGHSRDSIAGPRHRSQHRDLSASWTRSCCGRYR